MFNINKALSKEAKMKGIEDNTYLPKSQALLLACMIYYSNEACPREYIYRLINDLDDFFPIKLFTGLIDLPFDKLYDQIIDYASFDDGDLAELFNTTVMVVYYHVGYCDKNKWNTYFDGCLNQNISENVKCNLIKEIINDACQAIDIPEVDVVKYEYGIDNVYLEEKNEKDKALDIIFLTLAKNIIDTLFDDDYLLSVFEENGFDLNKVINNKKVYHQEYMNVFYALKEFYNIYLGNFK